MSSSSVVDVYVNVGLVVVVGDMTRWSVVPIGRVWIGGSKVLLLLLANPSIDGRGVASDIPKPNPFTACGKLPGGSGLIIESPPNGG